MPHRTIVFGTAVPRERGTECDTFPPCPAAVPQRWIGSAELGPDPHTVGKDGHQLQQAIGLSVEFRGHLSRGL